MHDAKITAQSCDKKFNPLSVTSRMCVGVCVCCARRRKRRDENKSELAAAVATAVHFHIMKLNNLRTRCKTKKKNKKAAPRIFDIIQFKCANVEWTKVKAHGIACERARARSHSHTCKAEHFHSNVDAVILVTWLDYMLASRTLCRPLDRTLCATSHHYSFPFRMISRAVRVQSVRRDMIVVSVTAMTMLFVK